MTTIHLDSGLLNDLWGTNHKHEDKDAGNIWSMNSTLSKINSNSSNSSHSSNGSNMSVDEKKYTYNNDYGYTSGQQVSIASVNSLQSMSGGSPNSLGSSATAATSIPSNSNSFVYTPNYNLNYTNQVNSLTSTPSSCQSPPHTQVLFNTSPIPSVTAPNSGANSGATIAPAVPGPVHNHQPNVSGTTHMAPIAGANSALEDKKPVNTQLYKTELCGSYMKLNYCPYGNKCQFAHGENELKRVERPANYRSKPCLNWSKYGSCRYGNRCCFKHGN